MYVGRPAARSVTECGFIIAIWSFTTIDSSSHLQSPATRTKRTILPNSRYQDELIVLLCGRRNGATACIETWTLVTTFRLNVDTSILKLVQ